jgi:hypothetical protein
MAEAVARVMCPAAEENSMKWWQIKKRDADLQRELRSDLELEEEEQRGSGISGEEARYAALRAFGNPSLIREQTRAIWSWNWLESLARDLRISLRTLRRTPGFTVIAILVMALGIGANVALFTVVRGVLLKPLPFHDPNRLVMLYEAGVHEDDTADSNVVSGGMYAEWKKQNRSYSSLALAQGIRVGLSGSGGQLPEKLKSALFSWDLLRTLGVQPALGRDFMQTDDSPAANGTVLLSWGLWKRRFGVHDQRATNHPQQYVGGGPVTLGHSQMEQFLKLHLHATVGMHVAQRAMLAGPNSVAGKKLYGLAERKLALFDSIKNRQRDRKLVDRLHWQLLVGGQLNFVRADVFNKLSYHFDGDLALVEL